jgi:hypothetical protein
MVHRNIVNLNSLGRVDLVSNKFVNNLRSSLRLLDALHEESERVLSPDNLKVFKNLIDFSKIYVVDLYYKNQLEIKSSHFQFNEESLVREYHLYTNYDPSDYKFYSFQDFMGSILIDKVKQDDCFMLKGIFDIFEGDQSKYFQNDLLPKLINFFKSFSFLADADLIQDVDSFKNIIASIYYEIILVSLDEKFSFGIKSTSDYSVESYPSCKIFFLELLNLINKGELSLVNTGDYWYDILVEKESVIIESDLSSVLKLISNKNYNPDTLSSVFNLSLPGYTSLSSKMNQSLLKLKYSNSYLYQIFNELDLLSNQESIQEVLYKNSNLILDRIGQSPQLLPYLFKDKSFREFFVVFYSNETFDYSKICNFDLEVCVKDFINDIFSFNQHKSNIESLSVLLDLFQKNQANEKFFEFLALLSDNINLTKSIRFKVTSFLKKYFIVIQSYNSYHQKTLLERLMLILEQDVDSRSLLQLLDKELLNFSLIDFYNPNYDISKVINELNVSNRIQNQIIAILKRLEIIKDKSSFDMFFTSLSSTVSGRYLDFKFNNTSFPESIVNNIGLASSSFSFRFAVDFEQFFTVGQSPVATCLSPTFMSRSQDLVSVICEPNITIYYMYRGTEVIARRMLFSVTHSGKNILFAAPIYTKEKDLAIYKTFDASLLKYANHHNLDLFLYHNSKLGVGETVYTPNSLNFSKVDVGSFELSLSFTKSCNFDFLGHSILTKYIEETDSYLLKFVSTGFYFSFKNNN